MFRFKSLSSVLIKLTLNRISYFVFRIWVEVSRYRLSGYSAYGLKLMPPWSPENTPAFCRTWFFSQGVSWLGQPSSTTTLRKSSLQTVQPILLAARCNHWVRAGGFRYLTYCRTDQVHVVEVDKAVALLDAVPWPASTP